MMSPTVVPAVRTDEIWKVFEHDGLSVEAVRGITISIGVGDFVVVAGPSGCGKTTLLNMLGGLTRPSRGRVWIGNEDLTDLSDKNLARLRLTQVGFVFQAYNLLPVLTASENAEFVLLLSGLPEHERRRRIETIFRAIGIGGLEDRFPAKLSGGEQQRVAVARAVVSEPTLVLADEPTANLDRAASDALLDLMVDLNRQRGTTFVFATHDPALMDRAKRIVRLVDGRIESDERHAPPSG
jgi:putative ABC transport system ATP-binding protein